MDLQQILAALLNPNGTQQAQPMPQMAAPQVGDHGAPFMPQSRLAAPPQAPQRASAPMAPQGQPQGAPQADAGYGMGDTGGGIGGLIQSIFQPHQAQKNATVQWLKGQGYDEGTATLLAQDKTALRQAILNRGQGSSRHTTTIDGKLIDTDTGTIIGDYSKPEVKTRTLTQDEVKAAGLAPGVWQIDKDNRISKAGDAAPVQGGKFRFDNTTNEGQALNGLMDSGRITEEQAQQIAAGKPITDPETGAVKFLTPGDIVTMWNQQTGGGTTQQPVGAAQQPPAPAPPPVRQGGTSMPSPERFGYAAGQATPAMPTTAAPTVAATPASPGMLTLTGGKPGKLATEAETKNRALYTVIKPEADIVEQNFDSMTQLANQAGGYLPASEYFTSSQYQRATNSLKTIVASYLYSVSGATANPGEVANLVSVLTPKPFESKVSLDDKRGRIKTMVEAVRISGGNVAPPSSSGGDGWKDLGGGVRIRKVN